MKQPRSPKRNQESSKNRPITNRLWRHRKALKLSQKRVASLLGQKSSSHVSRWENGKKTPTLDSALMLAHVLETPVENLFAERARELGEQIDARDPKKNGT